MSRSRCTFRQRDVTRAVKAVVAAGVEIACIEVDTAGKIVIMARKPATDTERNEWDEVFDGADQTQVRQRIP